MNWLPFWLTRWWWSYMLEPRCDPGYWWHEVLWCRARGHPPGVWWFKIGNEPDMHCKGCGDDLG